MSTPYQSAPDLIRKATPDEIWIGQQVERIAPHAHEMGSDGAYSRALESLALEQRNELARLRAFLELWAKHTDIIVSGISLAVEVNKLLGHCPVVQFVPADDTEGGHHD